VEFEDMKRKKMAAIGFGILITILIILIIVFSSGSKEEEVVKVVLEEKGIDRGVDAVLQCSHTFE
jgi:hypothetical protein